MKKILCFLILTIFVVQSVFAASFYVQSGTKATIVTKTGAYTLTSSDEIVLGDTNAFTLTLPTAVGITGTVYTIKKINTEYDEALTIDGNGSQTIDGNLTHLLYDVNSGISIVSDGSNWLVINSF